MIHYIKTENSCPGSAPLILQRQIALHLKAKLVTDLQNILLQSEGGSLAAISEKSSLPESLPEGFLFTPCLHTLKQLLICTCSLQLCLPFPQAARARERMQMLVFYVQIQEQNSHHIHSIIDQQNCHLSLFFQGLCFQGTNMGGNPHFSDRMSPSLTRMKKALLLQG